MHTHTYSDIRRISLSFFLSFFLSNIHLTLITYVFMINSNPQLWHLSRIFARFSNFSRTGKNIASMQRHRRRVRGRSSMCLMIFIIRKLVSLVTIIYLTCCSLQIVRWFPKGEMFVSRYTQVYSHALTFSLSSSFSLSFSHCRDVSHTHASPYICILFILALFKAAITLN